MKIEVMLQHAKKSSTQIDTVTITGHFSSGKVIQGRVWGFRGSVC